MSTSVPTLSVSASGDGVSLLPAPGPSQFIRVKGVNLSSIAQGIIGLTSGVGGPSLCSTEQLNLTGGGNWSTPSGSNYDCQPGQPLVLSNPSTVLVKGSIGYLILGQPSQV